MAAKKAWPPRGQNTRRDCRWGKSPSVHGVYNRVMKTILVFSALLLPPATAFAQQGKVGWEPTIEDAVKAAEKSGKPIFLFFGCN